MAQWAQQNPLQMELNKGFSRSEWYFNAILEKMKHLEKRQSQDALNECCRHLKQELWDLEIDKLGRGKTLEFQQAETIRYCSKRWRTVMCYALKHLKRTELYAIPLQVWTSCCLEIASLSDDLLRNYPGTQDAGLEPPLRTLQAIKLLSVAALHETKELKDLVELDSEDIKVWILEKKDADDLEEVLPLLLQALSEMEEVEEIHKRQPGAQRLHKWIVKQDPFFSGTKLLQEVRMKIFELKAAANAKAGSW